VDLYDADPDRVAVVPPGVDLDLFSPGSKPAARRALGIADDAYLLLFVGRIQPLKAPDVLLRAAARLVALRPSLRERLVVAVVGGPSGTGLARPESLQSLAAELGIADLVRFVPPVPQAELPDWYRAADVTVVPSYSESFGLVAIESQACGTPVVAASVGGLRTAVADGSSGVLIDGHDPSAYGDVLADLARDPARRAALSRGALLHAGRFGWAATAAGMLAVYSDALLEREAAPAIAVGR
jgi:D-inositol-3-phosphate glycosyltransferase